MHTLNLHLLRIFFTVAEQGSFSQAALALHISQPAVSKGVRELEQQLGLALVERGAPSAPRTLRLSESGTALHAHARGIFALERAALDDIRARIGLQRGRLVVGASSTIAGYWLPAQIAAFTQQHPHVDLEICGGNTQSIVQALLDGALDMALIEGSVQAPHTTERITCTHWRDDWLHLFAHPAQVQAAAVNLPAQRWLQREAGSGTREVADQWLAAQGLQPAHTVTLGSNEGIARAVAAGAGVALLPAQVCQELLALGQIATLPEASHPPVQRPLWLLQLCKRPPSPLAQAFLQAVQQPDGQA